MSIYYNLSGELDTFCPLALFCKKEHNALITHQHQFRLSDKEIMNLQYFGNELNKERKVNIQSGADDVLEGREAASLSPARRQILPALSINNYWMRLSMIS